MWTVSRGIGIFVFLSGISAGAADTPRLERNQAHPDAAGEVVTVQGKVMVRQEADAAAAPFQIKPGQNVYAGDVINTSSDGAIKILLKDKSIVDLGASSLFKVQGFVAKDGANREVDLDMKFGRLRVSVSRKIGEGGRFNVKTKAATMGVRGTEFVVNSQMGDVRKGESAPKTEVTVLQGKVDVASPTASGGGIGQEVKSLTAGGKIATSMGAAPQLMQLDQRQMQAESKMAKVSDNSFMKAITVEPKKEQAQSNGPQGGSGNSNQVASKGGDRAVASDGASGSSESGSGDSGSAGSGGGETSVASAAPAPATEGSLASAIQELAVQAPPAPIAVSDVSVPGVPTVINTTALPVNNFNRSFRVTVIVGQ